MTELYVFRGTTRHAEMVTDDKSGKLDADCREVHSTARGGGR